MRKNLATLALVALALVTFQPHPANAVGCVSGGAGTVQSPRVLCNGTDFIELQTATSGHYVLGSDIDLTGVAWDRNSNFNGTLDGTGHTVRSLEIISNSSTQVNGLFDDLGVNSVIENIRFSDATLYVDNRGYAGILAYGIYGRLNNVVVDGSVETNSGYTGGLAGQLNGGQITNTISNVTMTHTSGGSYMGGFVGTVSGTPDVSIGTISNSIYTGTMTGGWTSPIALEGMPWWDPNLNSDPPSPTCGYVVQSYFLSTSSNNAEGCGASKTESELASSNSTTEGFTTWSTDLWFFGQGVVLPQLKQFAAAPNQALFPTVIAGRSCINLTWLPPLGEYITGFDVQTRTRTTYWTDASKTLVGDGATISSVANGTEYWVRVRSMNPNGKSEWSYVSAPVVPIDVTSMVNGLRATSKKGVVTVTWAVPTSTNGSNVSLYKVGLYKSASASTPYKVVKAGTNLKYVIKGLKMRSNVWIAVQTDNGAGSSPFSTKVKVTIK